MIQIFFRDLIHWKTDIAHSQFSNWYEPTGNDCDEYFDLFDAYPNLGDFIQAYGKHCVKTPTTTEIHTTNQQGDGVVTKESQIGVSGVHKYFREVPHSNHMEERGSAQAKEAFDEAFGTDGIGLQGVHQYFKLNQ